MKTRNALTAVSPVDGRYHEKTSELSPYFSEYGLIRYRVLVEVEYFIALCEIPLPELKDVQGKTDFEDLRALYFDFTEEEAQRVKTIEARTNHDVKAVEYYLKEKFDQLQLNEYSGFLHFGLTSQDINNTAMPYMLRDALHNTFYPQLEQLVDQLHHRAKDWADIPMLARTHGQPASPTRLGKEMYVFVERLKNQLLMLRKVPSEAKFGGATGNFNAHHVAYPEVDWVAFANRFVADKLKLERLQTTTQIAHYDNLAAVFDNLKRINSILIDFSRDIWYYISMSYFRQRIQKDEVGSSAMPHKVNPIDFENAEGNLGIASALLNHLAQKLPVSRLQRDLTDSTVIRNVGMPLAHILIAIKSIQKGLGKLMINQEQIDHDLDENWMVVSEAIQTLLRVHGYPRPYEALKQLTRTHQKITQEDIAEFIDTLDIDDTLKEKLKQITPYNYTGIKLV